MRFATRFAPSPTGPLHLGHGYSAMLAHDIARTAGGTFLLRIEDIDQSRCRPDWERQILHDLTWLGLRWPTPVLRQSDRQAAYDQALDTLWQAGVIYACTCTRRDIRDALSAPQEGHAATGPDGLIYPGTCRPTVPGQTADRPRDVSLRLNLAAAFAWLESGTGAWHFDERGEGPDGETGRIRFSQQEMIDTVGDFVVARKDMGTSYHLSVVLDDAAQGITHVVRGQDLFEATKIHVLLQRLLSLDTPVYHHHRLIRDETGKRLAKRDDARALAKYRDEGASPAEIRAMVGLPPAD